MTTCPRHAEAMVWEIKQLQTRCNSGRDWVDYILANSKDLRIEYCSTICVSRDLCDGYKGLIKRREEDG